MKNLDEKMIKKIDDIIFKTNDLNIYPKELLIDIYLLSKIDEITEKDEIWKFVLDNKKYLVSNHGRVFSLYYNILLKPAISRDGYYMQTLTYLNGVRYGKTNHRLVAEVFVFNDKPEEKKYVDHIDCNKLNNDASNLEWVTMQENNKRAKENGLYRPSCGEKSNLSTLKEKDVHKICQLHESGMNYNEIRKTTGFKKGAIIAILLGKTWKHISCNYKLWYNPKKYINSNKIGGDYNSWERSRQNK